MPIGVQTACRFTPRLEQIVLARLPPFPWLHPGSRKSDAIEPDNAGKFCKKIGKNLLLDDVQTAGVTPLKRGVAET